MHDFKKLTVWQEAMDMVVETYQATSLFPPAEKFSLTSQLNRSAVSIPSNISEGAGRQTKGEFHLFLGYASGSCTEMETQLILAYRLKFLQETQCMALSEKLSRVRKMLYKLMKSVKES